MEKKFKEGQLVKLIGGTNEPWEVLNYQTQNLNSRNRFGIMESGTREIVNCVWIYKTGKKYDSFEESELKSYNE